MYYNLTPSLFKLYIFIHWKRFESEFVIKYTMLSEPHEKRVRREMATRYDIIGRNLFEFCGERA